MTLLLHGTVQLNGFDLAVDLDLGSGRTIAVVGPNGAGKSTLLRTVAGLQPLTSGALHLGDTPLDDPARDVFVPPHRRAVAVVFQDNQLFPHLSALDNVAFGLRGRRPDTRRRAQALLDQVGLGHRAGARPATLSGGEAQRVALARALATDPSVLLLDEPLAALDAHTRNDIRRELRRHLASFPGFRILVTHDPVDAAVLADHVVVLDGGRVAQTGTPAEITQRPRTHWVAQLAGINLFAGHARADGHLILDAGGELVVADVTEPGPVFAALSPRAVSLSTSQPHGSPRNTWPGRVVAVDTIGDRVRVQVAATPSVVAEVTPAAVHDLALHDGSDVWIAVKATEIDVYPA